MKTLHQYTCIHVHVHVFNMFCNWVYSNVWCILLAHKNKHRISYSHKHCAFHYRKVSWFTQSDYVPLDLCTVCELKPLFWKLLHHHKNYKVHIQTTRSTTIYDVPKYERRSNWRKQKRSKRYIMRCIVVVYYTQCINYSLSPIIWGFDSVFVSAESNWIVGSAPHKIGGCRVKSIPWQASTTTVAHSPQWAGRECVDNNKKTKMKRRNVQKITVQIIRMTIIRKVTINNSSVNYINIQ